MSATAVRILEQFRELSVPERRELIQILLKESEGAGTAPPRRRTLDEVLGKFTPLPEPEVKDHNYWFAEAVLASKAGRRGAVKIVFADTSGFYAALDRANPFHAEAARCFRQAQAEGWRLVTSNYVIHETWALVQNRLGWDGVEAFLDGLLPLCEMMWVEESVHHDGAARCRRERKRLLSLTDCTSFELMARLRADRSNCAGQAFCPARHSSSRGRSTVTEPRVSAALATKRGGALTAGSRGATVWGMTKVEEIKAEIDKLSFEERCELNALLNPLPDDEWDKQMRADAGARGKAAQADARS